MITYVRGFMGLFGQATQLGAALDAMAGPARYFGVVALPPPPQKKSDPVGARLQVRPVGYGGESQPAFWWMREGAQEQAALCNEIARSDRTGWRYAMAEVIVGTRST